MSERVNYDRVAPLYESRYQRNDYSGVERAVASFVEVTRGGSGRVLEVGCGGGHWLRTLADAGIVVFGLDPSEGMLTVARSSVGPRCLTRGRAETLPYAEASYDRLFCVNALHHVEDPAAFVREARRVLRPAGGLLTIGLDPHTGRDRWWIYDYFPETLIADRKRYLPAHEIREMMASSGFANCETRMIHHVPWQMTLTEARSGGFMDRTSTSQLMVIPDAAYQEGLERIKVADATSGGATIVRSDLRLYATTGWAA